MRIYIIGLIILALLGSVGYVLKLQRDNAILRDISEQRDIAIQRDIVWFRN